MIDCHRSLAAMLVIGLILLGTSVSAGPLGDAIRETERVLSRLPTGEPRCFPDIDGPADMHVITSYNGGETVDPSVAPHTPKYIDVRVEPMAHPALLVLSAYEPVVWRIDARPEAQIAGIYLAGHYEQMISGLPDGVPLGRAFFRLRNDERKEPCRMEGMPPVRITDGRTWPLFSRLNFLDSHGEVEKLLPAIREFETVEMASFQRIIQPFYHAVVSEAKVEEYRRRKEEGAATLAALRMPEFAVLEKDAPVLSTYDVTNQQAIKLFLRKGYLEGEGPGRDYYCKKVTAETLARGGLPRKACGRVLRGGLYTILGPIVLPAGLCGAYGTMFLLPPGVPEPGGCLEFRNLIRLDDMR